jgi:hypothetical protein
LFCLNDSNADRYTHVTGKGEAMRTPKKGLLGKPRNPLVAPAMQRKAGSHQKTTKQERLQHKAALRRDKDVLQ